jgi:transposase
VLVAIWHAFLDTLDERGLLDWDEVFVDASFSPAKKGATTSEKPSGERVQEWLLVADGQGIPLAFRTERASPAEVTLVEGVIDQVPVGDKPTPVIADRAYDSDPLREKLLAKGWDLVCPNRRRRVRPRTQDGRKLRRYRRRWKIERTIAWLSNYRRLIVRHEYYSIIYQGFIHLACILICLRRF